MALPGHLGGHPGHTTATGHKPAMNYWAKFYRRAWSEASQEVGLGSLKRLVVVLFVQLIIFVAGYFLLPKSGVFANAVIRLATVAAPVIILFILFALRSLALGPEVLSELEEALTSGLKCSFDPVTPGCIEVTNYTGNPLRFAFVRLKVETAGSRNVSGCTGHLISILRNGKEILGGNPLSLPFAPAEYGLAPRDVKSGVPMFLDVFAMGEDGTLRSLNPIWPNSISQSAFSEKGEYIFTVVVNCSLGGSVTKHLSLLWNGDPAGAAIADADVAA